MAFQAYLIEGLARWNIQRREDSMEGKEVAQSFDVALKHRFNALSSDIHKEPVLTSFSTPPVYTGEVIGMSYLHSQTGDSAGEMEELDREIDEAFVDFEIHPEDDEGNFDMEDATTALPDDSSDSGNEVIIIQICQKSRIVK